MTARLAELDGPTTNRFEVQRARGDSLRAIAELLNADHVPTAQGGAQWHASTVRHVLLRRLGVCRGEDAPWPTGLVGLTGRELRDVEGLKAVVADVDLECDPHPLAQAAARSDLREVEHEVIVALVRADRPESLVAVEGFHGSCCEDSLGEETFEVELVEQVGVWAGHETMVAAGGPVCHPGIDNSRFAENPSELAAFSGLRGSGAARTSTLLTKPVDQLSVMSWLYGRSTDPAVDFLRAKFGNKAPQIAEANVKALHAGYALGETTDGARATSPNSRRTRTHALARPRRRTGVDRRRRRGK